MSGGLGKGRGAQHPPPRADASRAHPACPRASSWRRPAVCWKPEDGRALLSYSHHSAPQELIPEEEEEKQSARRGASPPSWEAAGWILPFSRAAAASGGRWGPPGRRVYRAPWCHQPHTLVTHPQGPTPEGQKLTSSMPWGKGLSSQSFSGKRWRICPCPSPLPAETRGGLEGGQPGILAALGHFRHRRGQH